MSGIISIKVPATITAIEGQPTLSSLAGLPYGLAVNDPNAGANITLKLVAANAAAAMSASAPSGATVSANSNTLVISGAQAQVNAALASLQISEAAGTSSDLISLLAADNYGSLASSTLALTLVPQSPPAFVDPTLLVTIAPNQPQLLPDLLLADPAASALAAMGLGAQETLQLTLSVSEGVLMLPGYSTLSGIAASGIGSGTIELTLAANEIGALNTLLTGLEFAGPTISGGQHLEYELWNLSGVLPQEVTYGNLFLYNVGLAPASASYTLGGQTLVTGGESLAGTLAVTGLTAMMGNLSAGGLSIAAGGVLEVAANSLLLSGTAYDFGGLAAQSVIESGQLLIGNAASLQGELVLGTNAVANFANGLVVSAGAANDYQEGISLAAGAILEGSGTLSVGDFSQSGMIDGSGTLLALGGSTLEIDAGLVATGVHLDVAGGGVMVLGPQTPLFGIFNTTPLTIASGVTLEFGGPGVATIGGGFAGTLGGSGGAFVITGPQDFSGTVTGFAVGDALIFPGLTGLTVKDVNTLAGTSSFVVTGVDSNGVTDSYTIAANIPAGLFPATSFDSAGDPEVVLHSSLATISNGGLFAASAGVSQPLLGLSLALAAPTTQALTLTLTTAHGSLSVGDSVGSALTLSAINLALMNAQLASLLYTGTGALDVLTISSGSGILSGLIDYEGIGKGSTGTVDGYSGLGLTTGEFVSFGNSGGLYTDHVAHALGGALITGAVDFEDPFQASGYSGTALEVDHNGLAIFGAAAQVAMAGNATLGDAGGAGALEVLSQAVSLAGTLTMAASGAGAGSLAVLGTMSIGGAALVGVAGNATLYASGDLAAGSLTLGSGGVLEATGAATLSLGSLSNRGGVTLAGGALLDAANYAGAGGMTLGGTAVMNIAGTASLSGGLVSLGVGTSLQAASLVETAGQLSLAGTLAATGAMSLSNAQLNDGWVQAGTLSLAGTLAGYGIIDAGTLIDTGTLAVQGGDLLLARGSLIGGGVVEIGSQATLELNSTDLSTTPISFTGTSSLLVLDNVAAGMPGIANMSSFDAVDLVGVAPSLVGLGGNTIDVRNAQGSLTAAFTLGTAAGALPAVSVIADGSGGALLTLGGELPCFARGTGILTPHGYRPIEALRPGDPVITARGERRPVRWLGWSVLDLNYGPGQEARPVLIRPGAFGPGKPARPVRLSPSHGVHVEGVLVPASCLVNGATILRDTAMPAITYYHLELDRHDALLAEGLPCESYFCDGNRDWLSHELGRRSPARRPFAATVSGGPRLAAIRRMLHEQALHSGFTPGFLPRLRAMAAGQDVLPCFSGPDGWRQARFSLAQPARELILLAPACAPAETDPDSEDRRALGLCLGDTPGLRLGAGWLARAPGDIGDWMGSRATLLSPRPRRHWALAIAALPQSWQRAQGSPPGFWPHPAIDAPGATG